MRYQTFTWRMNRAAHQRCYRIPTKWHIIHRSSLYLMATALIVGEVILKFFSWKHGSWWSTVSMLMFCLLWWTTSREKKKTADWWQVTIVMSVGKWVKLLTSSLTASTLPSPFVAAQRPSHTIAGFRYFNNFLHFRLITAYRFQIIITCFLLDSLDLKAHVSIIFSIPTSKHKFFCRCHCSTCDCYKQNILLRIPLM